MGAAEAAALISTAGVAGSTATPTGAAARGAAELRCGGFDSRTPGRAELAARAADDAERRPGVPEVRAAGGAALPLRARPFAGGAALAFVGRALMARAFASDAGARLTCVASALGAGLFDSTAGTPPLALGRALVARALSGAATALRVVAARAL